MLRTTMIVLATAAALTVGLTADAFARGGGGGGGHMGGGFGGTHIGSGFGGTHVGGGFGGAQIGSGVGHGIAGQHIAGPRFAHDGHLRYGLGTGDYGLYDYGCGYGDPNYNPYTNSCYLPAY